MTLRSYIKYLIPIILAAVVVVMCSSNNKEKPGREYMPDMTHSLAYETYTESKDNPAFKGGQTALLPPEGSIPVGAEVYHTPNTPEGYEEAALRTSNPVELTDENLIRGQAIYTIHCTPCHGVTGDGQGTAVVGSDYKLAAPPISFVNPEAGYLTPGRMFHTITYGKGLMGSYAAAVSTEDRWNVIHYIQSLEETEENTAAADAEVADSTAQTPEAAQDSM